MVTERIDGADWPPGCESDAGYYGVRVGETVSLVDLAYYDAQFNSTALSECAWSSYDPSGPLDGPRGGCVAGGRTRIAAGAVPPSNPWTRYGLNAREYGWHAPRGRA